MMLGPVTRVIVITAIGFAVLCAVMTARAVVEARAEAAQASDAFSRGDVELTIVHLRNGARWVAPFNAYAAQSLDRLEQLAAELAAHDPVHALMAYRSLHAAIMATRSFYTPHAEQLARADDQIASLMAAEPPAPIDAARSPAQRKAEFLALLAPQDPDALGVLLASAGFVTWVGSAVVFLSWGVDREGRILRAVAKRAVLCLLLGWIAFAVGLRIA